MGFILSSNLKTSRHKEKRFVPVEPKKHHLFHSTHYQYCHKYIPKKHKVKRQTFIEVTRHIFSQIPKGLIEERDGVVLDYFGYFFVFMTPKTRVFYKGNCNKNVLGRSYYPMFRGIGRTNPLVDYYIPYNALKLREQINRRVRNGQLYTFSLSILQDKSVELEYEKYLQKRRRD